MVWGAVVIALMLAVGSLTAEGGFRRYARLKREVQRVRTEPAAIERAARESLGLVRSGEVVFNLETP